MLNIVIPMAGAGSRFVNAGYHIPKPLILIHGIPMIQLVIGNLTPREPHRFIFICQQSHVLAFGLSEKLLKWAPNSIILELGSITSGAACTVLLAKSQINNDNPLMIANCDQYVNVDINRYLQVLSEKKLDGLIMTMQADDAKWSYVGLDKDHNVTSVVEKQVISDEATVGIYNFRKGSCFVKAAEEMITANEHVNGEFYVAPTYNRLINRGQRIGIHNIGSIGKGMHGLGIPADLQSFLALPLSTALTEKQYDYN